MFRRLLLACALATVAAPTAAVAMQNIKCIPAERLMVRKLLGQAYALRKDLDGERVKAGTPKAAAYLNDRIRELNKVKRDLSGKVRTPALRKRLDRFGRDLSEIAAGLKRAAKTEERGAIRKAIQPLRKVLDRELEGFEPKRR